MSETMLSDFTEYFDGLPDVVRNELSFMLVTFAVDDADPTEGALDHERTARALFTATTRIGRIGDLISAAAVFDVYFAMDTDRRFDGEEAGATRTRYSVRRAAIESARRQWHALRRTRLSPATIGAALSPGATDHASAIRSAA